MSKTSETSGNALPEVFNLTDRWVCDRRGRALGPVDSRDSHLDRSMIQDCFLGGRLGCDGPFGFERCGMGTDGASDYKSA